MVRRATSDVFGDGTRNYFVEDYKATTVGEFTEEVLTQFPNERGNFYFEGKRHKKSIYSDGELVSCFDDSIIEEPIYYVTANGGWSLMDYDIYTGK